MSQRFANSRRFSLASMPWDLQAEVAIATNGAAVALVKDASHNQGILSFTHVKDSAAAAAGGEVYVLGLEDQYVRTIDGYLTKIKQAPACDNFWLPAHAAGGGVAAILMTSPANTHYIRLIRPAGFSASGTCSSSDAISGTAPSMTLTSGTTRLAQAGCVGQNIVITGATNAANNGTFPITGVTASTGAIAYTNANGVAEATTPCTYTVKYAYLTLTALTNAGSPVDSQWVVGTAGTINADSATAFANLINQAAAGSVADGTTNGGCVALNNLPITAYNSGACVGFSTTEPGWQICSHSQTAELIVTSAANTVDVYSVMPPGWVMAFLAGAAPTIPATGDNYRIHLALENSSNSP